MKVYPVKQDYDVIVVGGGAAGMAASVKAAERGRQVLLLEKADRPGRKILASGNGRCNLMNNGIPRYYGDAEFAEKVFSHCSAKQVAEFFTGYGLMLCEETDGRVYPATYQAASVFSLFKNAMQMNGVNIKMRTAAASVKRLGNDYQLLTESGETYHAGKLIIACGGAACTRLGGTRDGYALLQSLGHTLEPVRPSLVPLITDTRSISGLSGIRLHARVTLLKRHSVVHTEEGEVLFTDCGVSGICVMQCARFAEGPECELRLDMIGHLLSDHASAKNELIRRRRIFGGCSPVWLLNGILPEKVSFAVLKQAGMQLRGETAGETGDSMIDRIIDTASSYRVTVTGTKGLEDAQVTAGGISCREFDPFTMESGISTGMHAAGEVLNVDGDCGGFNLMFAFASGLIAGSAV